MVSDKKGIYPDSELMVKDREATWQEIRESLQLVQVRQRKWHYKTDSLLLNMSH